MVCDEAYVEYVDDASFPDSLGWVREGKPVVVLRTFSKVYGLAGLRIGYGIAPPYLIENIRRVKEPFNVNRLAQAAACEALRDEEHVGRSVRLNAEERERLRQRLETLGCTVTPSQANFLWVDLGRDCRPVLEALLQRGVIIRGGDAFGQPHHVRITIGKKGRERQTAAEPRTSSAVNPSQVWGKESVRVIVIMEPQADQSQIERVVDRLKEFGFDTHISAGVERTIIGAIGQKNELQVQQIEAMQGVERILPILQPFKLASREFRPERSQVKVGDVVFGGTHIPVIAGPCAVESEEQMLAAAQAVKDAGAHILRVEPTNPAHLRMHSRD